MLESCFGSYQRTNDVRLGIFLGLTIKAGGLSEEPSELPLPSVFADGAAGDPGQAWPCVLPGRTVPVGFTRSLQPRCRSFCPAPTGRSGLCRPGQPLRFPLQAAGSSHRAEASLPRGGRCSQTAEDTQVFLMACPSSGWWPAALQDAGTLGRIRSPRAAAR